MSFTTEELAGECWRPIPGWDGYEASSLGRVRCWRHANGRPGRKATPRIRKLSKGTGGYLKVSLGTGKEHICPSVHKLVLEAFVGPRPEGMVACHFPDPTKSNNRITNLRWGTAKDNSDDREIHGNTARGDRSGARRHPERVRRGQGVNTSKLSEGAVRLMRYLHIVHRSSPYTMAKWFDVSQPSSVAICNGRYWKHVPMQAAELEWGAT